MDKYTFYIITHSREGGILSTTDVTVWADSQEQAEEQARRYLNPYWYQTTSQVKKVAK